MSDDEEAAPRPRKRIKRHIFKSDAQKISEVKLDVYRSLEPAPASPPHDILAPTSHLHREVEKQRELNTAHDFTQLAHALHPISLTPAQVLHHQEEILGHILGALRVDAVLSADGVLPLLPALARDVGLDFLPALPRITSHLDNLLQNGGEREAELLEHAFTALAGTDEAVCHSPGGELAGSPPHVHPAAVFPLPASAPPCRLSLLFPLPTSQPPMHCGPGFEPSWQRRC
eukprot:jgi/Botrbrau1/5277/Bobra.0172s0132.1